MQPELRGTFTGLTNMQVYGDVELQKEECVNHIAKRLNTALSKLASSGKKAGVTLGGHVFGKLTGKKIETLSRYYRMAVQAHQHDVNGIQNEILASFEHSSSTDESPQHDRCLVGARSWCFYQTTLATGQEPGPHRTNVGKSLAPDVVVSATCSAVSQFNAGIKVTTKNLCEANDVEDI